MATTTRLGLFKPAGTDLVDRVADLNNAYDILDSKMPAVVCTSSTRPTGGNLYNGLIIYETDTKNYYCYDQGSTAWRPVARLYQGGSGNSYIFSVTDNMDIAFGSHASLTNASGDVGLVGLIIAATGWTNVYRMIYQNGDAAARTNMTIGNIVTVFPATSGNIRCFIGNTGGVVVSATVRVDWVAIGK